MSEQIPSGISDERLEELAKLDCLAGHWETSDCHICERRELARELIQVRSDLADVEDLLPAPTGPYQTMGERTKLLKDQGEYAQEMCGDAVKLLEAAQDELTALRRGLIQGGDWTFMGKKLAALAGIIHIRRRLVEALDVCCAALQRCYNVTDWPGDGTSDQDNALKVGRSALAEAAKLEGK